MSRGRHFLSGNVGSLALGDYFCGVGIVGWLVIFIALFAFIEFGRHVDLVGPFGHAHLNLHPI